jgi:hypothetical protein
MSTLKTNNVQIGKSNTATQNFVLSTPVTPDGTIKLARGNLGATTQDVLSVGADGKVAFPAGSTVDVALVPTGGTTGQVLAKTSNTNYAATWTTPTDPIPVQTNNSGKFLTTDGSTTSWSASVATLTGSETLTNKKISALYIVDKTTTNAAVSGTLNLDVSTGTVFNLTLAANSTLAIINAPTLTNETLTFTVRVTQPVVAYTLTWWSGISWLTTGGTAPTAPAASKTIEYIFTSNSAGVYEGRKGAST